MAGFLPIANTEIKDTINDQLEWLYSNGVCAYETELPDGRKPILLYVAALWGGDSFYELESLGLGNIVKLDIILNLKRNLARPGFEPGTVRSEVDRANHYSIAAWWIHGQIVINVKRLSFFFNTRNLIFVQIFAFWGCPGLWGPHGSLCEHSQGSNHQWKLDC